ncbi:MAG TPA: DUF3298 domain-containing protein [Pedobacter sp.]|uniref:DUF3298 and DUF4163 domain-containing protein n=1 Tax=Pedobacter sp. TaxID=1411316 RepID=UPI002B9870F1|nr:DUF3298 domain-containing protein [Pedobacter sp.]HMI02954.1 DUF3298 domain-containing protein [Pedobacter sp.]
MKRTGIFVLLISFMACQSEKKTTDATDSATMSGTAKTIIYTYDSVKVYSKNPLSKDKNVTDTSKAVISYPVFADEHMNDFILKKVLLTADSGKNYTSYQAYATDFIKGFDDFQKTEKDSPQTWFLEIRNDVEVQKTGYFSILSRFVSYMGGAHPNTVYSYLNYNPTTHQEILLDSLLLPGTMPKLTAIAEQIFRKNEKLSSTASLKDGYFFENNTFRLNDNFTITDEGLKFLYNPYEIKAYVYGTTELLIPFSALKGIAKPNSLLSPSH